MPNLPQFPYLAQDRDQAKAHHTLPPERDAHGAPIAAVVPLVVAAPLPLIPPPVAPPVVVAPAAAPIPVLPQVPQPENAYPFSFWPARPWNIEPAFDPLHDSDNTQNTWMRSRPHMWPGADETDWRGVKFLGVGTYGRAGLWCRIDDNGNIVQVRNNLSC
jgi:hypothetical protein